MQLSTFPQSSPQTQKAILIALTLVAATLTVYWQVQGFDFVYYDDQVYVTENTHVRQGLTWENIKWAFTTTECGFYQPLTWLTYLVDYELYGSKAGGYHWTNVIFHLMNAVLLFWALSLMTESLWRSGFVAALFTLHPLHVESVAWIAQRKDLVSGFFWMLTMLTYFYYTKTPGIYRYLLVMLMFVLGLMAKPMAMTLPFVLLLLDFWPLGRFDAKDPRSPWKITGTYWLMIEKLPMVLFSVLAGIMSIYAEKQVGALKSLTMIPLGDRLANAVISYGQYLVKTIWPVDLAIFYPYPVHWSPSFLMISGLIVTILSLAVLTWHRTFPYLAVGWLWFLGSMIPVIGLVQVGMHANADRYTYIPLIGLFIAMVWTGHDFAKTIKGKSKKYLLPLVGAVLMIMLGLLTWKQIQHWQNAEILFRHTLSVTHDNYIAHNSLGAALARKGHQSEALSHYREAVRIRPDYPLALFNIGTSLAAQKNYLQSVPFFMKAINLDPTFAAAQNNLGISLVHLGRIREAIPYFREALRLQPDYDPAKRNLDQAWKDLSKREDASSSSVK